MSSQDTIQVTVDAAALEIEADALKRDAMRGLVRDYFDWETTTSLTMVLVSQQGHRRDTYKIKAFPGWVANENETCTDRLRVGSFLRNDVRPQLSHYVGFNATRCTLVVLDAGQRVLHESAPITGLLHVESVP